MRSVTAVGVVSGPLIVLAYLLGSCARWRNPLARRPGTPPAGQAGQATLPPRTQLVVDVGLVLVAYIVAEQAVHAVAPGTTFSRVASLSSQVLFVWDSVALWCALAAVVGIVAPAWTRFRDGGDALAAVLALLVFRAPTVGVAAAVAFVVAVVATGSPRRAVPVALGAAILAEWLLWVFDAWPPWGVPNGPELALWLTVTSGVLLARWMRGDVPVGGGPPPDAGSQ